MQHFSDLRILSVIGDSKNYLQLDLRHAAEVEM